MLLPLPAVVVGGLGVLTLCTFLDSAGPARVQLVGKDDPRLLDVRSCLEDAFVAVCQTPMPKIDRLCTPQRECVSYDGVFIRLFITRIPLDDDLHI